MRGPPVGNRTGPFLSRHSDIGWCPGPFSSRLSKSAKPRPQGWSDELREPVSEGAENQVSLGQVALFRRVSFFRKAFLAQEMCLHPEDTVRFEHVGKHAVSVDFAYVGKVEGY